MKKSIYLALAIFLICCINVGCGSEEASNTNNETLVSTTLSNTAVLSNSANATKISNSANASRISNSANATRDTQAIDSQVAKEKIDYDLLGFNQTMLYSQVTNIVNDYTSYLGKRIRLKGNMQVVDGGNGKYYYMVNCGDVTACCTSGFEFILKGGSEDPSDYPENGKEITVNGVLAEYYEGEQKYIHLVDSTVSSIIKSK